MSIEAALQVLRRGGIVGVPTDTVYGLGVDPHEPAAVQALFRLKGRGSNLPIAVLVSSVAQAESLVEFPPGVRDLVEPHWPGAFTAVLGWRVEMAEGVGDHRRATLAVRLPDHQILRDLLDRSGPLAVTSANQSGFPPVRTASEARGLFGDRVGLYLEGRSDGGTASTVVDLTRRPPQVLREGPVRFP